MIWENASFWLLVVLCGGLYVIALPAIRAVREEERKLTEDELKTYRENYSRRDRQHTMPDKFAALATAQRRVSRIWFLGMIALVVSLFWINFSGPSLGLY
jgi:hypothetical protein